MSDEADVQNRAAQRIGTVLHGKYRLDAVLGIGGMAVVYAATHRNQKEFAVKVLHPEFSVRSELRARFLREGYAANSVAHPGVVAVLDDDVDELGTAFLVMDLLRGADVELLRSQSNGRLPLRLALAVALQVLDVLDAAHRKAIVHRDLKPANFFVLESGQVKVLDFGIAQLRESASQIQTTRSGAVLGSPAFMAPEQAAARNNEVDARTDLWALGATLFTLLSGQFVHAGENGQQTLIRAATTPARSLRSAAPELPAQLVELVDQALQFEPAARFESAAEMRGAVARAHRDLFGEVSLQPLQQCVAGCGAPRFPVSSPKPVAAVTPEARARRGRRAVALFALAAAGLGSVMVARAALAPRARSEARAQPSASLSVTQAAAPFARSPESAPSSSPVPSPAPAVTAKTASSIRPRASLAAPKATLAKLALGPAHPSPALAAGVAPASTATGTPLAPRNPLELELQ